MTSPKIAVEQKELAVETQSARPVLKLVKTEPESRLVALFEEFSANLEIEIKQILDL